MFWPTRNAEIVVGTWTLENYGTVFGDPTYWRTLISSFIFVTFATLLSLVIALPFSYFVALRARPERRAYWVLAAVLPFSASYLIRIYAWLGLFGDRGLINDTLLRLHVIRDPLGVFSYGQPAVVITFVAVSVGAPSKPGVETGIGSASRPLPSRLSASPLITTS